MYFLYNKSKQSQNLSLSCLFVSLLTLLLTSKRLTRIESHCILPAVWWRARPVWHGSNLPGCQFGMCPAPPAATQQQQPPSSADKPWGSCSIRQKAEGWTHHFWTTKLCFSTWFSVPGLLADHLSNRWQTGCLVLWYFISIALNLKCIYIHALTYTHTQAHTHIDTHTHTWHRYSGTHSQTHQHTHTCNLSLSHTHTQVGTVGNPTCCSLCTLYNLHKDVSLQCPFLVDLVKRRELCRHKSGTVISFFSWTTVLYKKFLSFCVII